MDSNENEKTQQNPKISEGGYGSPTPEDEIPEGVAIDPDSLHSTLSGQASEEHSLREDEGIETPDKDFLENDDASSDGEPGAGQLGGTDDQLREELARAEGNTRGVDDENDIPLEAPSTEAPLNESNAGPTRTERESFSSESDAEAAGGS